MYFSSLIEKTTKSDGQKAKEIFNELNFDELDLNYQKLVFCLPFTT